MNSPVVLSNTRRNLFGIRLNQDQLKTDLNVIWKEQVERQARRWNFDFESLRPLDSEGSVIMHSSPIRVIKRFEWSEVGSVPRQKQQQRFAGHPIKYARYESEDEEFDQELAVPAFYQHQRVRKMHQEEKSQAQRLKQVRLDTIAKCQTDKTMTQTIIEPKTVKVSPKKMTKKKSQKQTTTAVAPGLIITFSENRKDTLRSATTGSSKKAKTKQPTILNLLKQKKKRANNGSSCGSSKEN